jgi:hypothetical protein
LLELFGVKIFAGYQIAISAERIFMAKDRMALKCRE